MSWCFFVIALRASHQVDTAEEEDAIDIDLNDPEVAAAAEKIQAGFKGYKARKEVAQMRVSTVFPFCFPCFSVADDDNVVLPVKSQKMDG